MKQFVALAAVRFAVGSIGRSSWRAGGGPWSPLIQSAAVSWPNAYPGEAGGAMCRGVYVVPVRVCARCGWPSGADWLDAGETCPNCKLVQ